jgi:hypothetical protein
MAESRIDRFVRYQRVLGRQRHVSFNAPWRVVIIALSALVLYYVWSTLTFKYAVASLPAGSPETIGSLLFSWFFYGALLGIITFALLFEGEYLIGVWRLAGKVEKGLERDAGRLLGKGPKRGK